MPEWRAQYLDYKTGKKKLKKLKNKPSVLNSIKSTPLLNNLSPALRTRSVVHGGKNRSSGTDIDARLRPAPSPLTGSCAKNNEENDSMFKASYANEDQISVDSNPSSNWALPDAVIDFQTPRYGSTKQHTSTPHLVVPGVEEDSNRPHDDTTPLLSYNNPHDRADTGLIEFQPAKRKSSVVALFDSFKRSPSTSYNRAAETELEDLATYARENFILWVDSELDKVEAFYRERENACVDRFLVLQDQMIQLQNQKLLSKKKWLRAKKMLKGQTGSHSQEGNVDVEDEDDDDDDVYEDDDDDDDNGYDEYLNWNFAGDFGNANPGVLTAAQRNFKLLSFWTKRKLRIINKFDMPSLPRFEWLKEGGKVEKQYYEDGYYSDDNNDDHDNPRNRDGTTSSTAHIRDFQRRRKKRNSAGTPHVPYFVARRMIKKAVHELYRSMELLKSYKLMNRIGFRKIIKKYDKTTGDTMLNVYMKKIDSAYFSTSDVLENLMTNVEELYTRYFENGNRKISITKLRTNVFEQTYYASDYLGGFFFGISIPLIAYTFYLGLKETLNGSLKDGKYLLQIWGGFLIIIMMSWLFAINCLVWTKFKVNYKFIFEFNQHDTLDFKQYMVLPSLFFAIGGLLAWLSFEDFWPNVFSGYDFPWIFLAIAIFVLLCPFDMFFLNARIWFLSTFTRLLLSGLYPVEFRDFFLGDIFCSLTYSMSNVSMFFCIYSNHWVDCSKCGSAESRLLGFMQCLPSIWRFLQCFRRYADTGDWFPHLANMAKYSVSTLYYMTLSMYRIETINKYKVLLIFWAATNSVYTSIWDILMDWSLFQFDSKYFLLRDEITFKSPKVYYAAMIFDVVLRFQWVFYVLFPKQIQQSAITSFCIAIAEIIRRFIWIFFRMENEHATNVHLFRASRESPLPYPVIKRVSGRSDVATGFDGEDLTDQDVRKRATTGTNQDLESNPHITTPQLAFIPTTADVASGNRPVVSTVLPRAISRHSSSVSGLRPTAGYEPQTSDYGHVIPDNRHTNGVFSSASRYFQQLSRTLRTAHIKDFQRRKVSKKQLIEEERAEEEEEQDGNGSESEN